VTVLICMLLLSLSRWVVVANPEQSVKVRPEDAFTLMLATPPDESWDFEFDHSIVHRVGSIEVYTFRAIRAGETVIHGWRARGDMRPSEVFRLKVEVTEDRMQ
jgi:hypothetical protein